MIVYLCMAATFLGLFLLYRFRLIRLSARFTFIVYLLAVAFGLTFEIGLGIQLELFHYYNVKDSPYWILIMALFFYPIYHIVYIALLAPSLTVRRWLLHTVLWIGFMLVFEYVTICLDVVVLTGWAIWPWSLLTYVSVYVLDTLLYLWMRPALQTVKE